MQEDCSVLFRGYAGGGVLLGIGGGAHLSAHPARVASVHADPPFRELGGQNLGEPLYPELADRISAPLGPALDAETAYYVDHGAAFGDVRDRRPGDEERPGEVGVYHLPPLVFGILFYSDPRTQQAGVVYEHVYPPETLDRLSDHPLDVVAIRHVCREGERLRARIFDLLGDRADGPLAAGVDRHPRALPRKGERERPAETLARTSDKCYLAFEHLSSPNRACQLSAVSYQLFDLADKLTADCSSCIKLKALCTTSVIPEGTASRPPPSFLPEPDLGGESIPVEVQVGGVCLDEAPHVDRLWHRRVVIAL